MSKTIVGGRAKVYVDNKLVGIFESCTVNEALTTEDIHILGKFGPAEIAITSYNSVTINCSGFRVAKNGAKTLPKFPKVKDLLTFEPFTIQVIDRQPVANGGSDIPLATIIGVTPETNNTNFNARATSRVNITYKGLMLTDESSANDGENDASELP